MTSPPELPAGPELDARVHHEVMGGEIPHRWIRWDQNLYQTCLWCGGQFRDGREEPKGCGVIPPYSTEIAAAMEAVGVITQGQHHAELVLVQDMSSAFRTRWWATFTEPREAPLDVKTWGCASDHGEGSSEALAISRAALLYAASHPRA